MPCRTLNWTCVWIPSPKSNCPSSGWDGTLLAAGQPQTWINGQSVAAEVWWLIPMLINPITQCNNSWWICGVWHPSIYYIAVLYFSFLPVSNNTKLLYRQYNCYTNLSVTVLSQVVFLSFIFPLYFLRGKLNNCDTNVSVCPTEDYTVCNHSDLF